MTFLKCDGSRLRGMMGMETNFVSRVDIPTEEFLRVYPFHFAWDERDVIIAAGPSLAKVAPLARTGARLQDVFRSKRPAGELSYAFAQKNSNRLIIVEDIQNNRILRGSILFVEASGVALMLATPWITDPQQLLEYHLTLDDFGVQDQTLDLLHLLQTQQMAVAELKQLNENLTRQRAKLRQQEEHSRKLALVAARTDNAVIVTDSNSRIEWVNESFTTITGWRLDEIIGRKPGEFLQGPDTDPAVVKRMSECVREGRGFSAEVLNYRRDGRSYWLSIEAQPLLDDAGEVVGFMAIERDVTELRRNQEAVEGYRQSLEQLVESRTEELKRNKFLLEAIIKTTPNGLLLIDREGLICMTNAALEQMFGYGDSELIGLPLENLVPQAKRDWHRAERAQFMQTPVSRPMGMGRNLLGQRKNGEVFSIDVSLASFSVNDEQYVQATVADITARKQAEDALRDLNANLERMVETRTAELAAASAAKSDFLANMSHEIRTPMNGILGLTQLLAREPLAPDHHEMVERIRHAGRSLLEILNDILDFSKIEAGQLRIDARPFDLPPIIAQISSLLGNTAHQKNLELRVEMDFDAGGALIGDPLRLEQILLNLVGNAIKFTKKGEVIIRVIALELSETEARLRFEVQDTGIGIAPEHRASLFTPFSQADKGITRRFGGTGLGLSICKRLAELMDGKMGVASAIGVGSTFWFEAPFKRLQGRRGPQKSFPAQPVAAGPRLSKLHCLVVDDSRTNRDVLERMLIREGARATMAENGQQALEHLMAQTDPFDAVLMDVQMPVMDGLTATRAIRGKLGFTDLPVIAVTAGVLAEQRDETRAAGCNDFLCKPIDHEELVSKLIEWTSGESASAVAEKGELASDFPKVRGIDVYKASAVLGHDPDLFVAMMKNFVEEFSAVAQEIRQDVESVEFEIAANRLHALRGAAGYIGATELMQSALELEVAITERRLDVDSLLLEFEAIFSALMKEIKNALLAGGALVANEPREDAGHR